jgi:glucose uptake protein GlcU
MRSWTTVLKYGAFVLAGTLWAFGLVDQFDSFEMTARYVGLSAMMVVVATV